MLPCARSCALAMALGLALGAAVPPPEPPQVECLRVGQGAETGRLLAIQGGQLTLETGAGRASFPVAAFREVVFPAPAASRRPPAFTVWGAGGSRLRVGKIDAGSAPGTVSLIGAGWRADALPLGSLRAVATRELMQGPQEALERFRAVRDDPPPGEDRLTIEREGRRQTVSCAVEGLSESAVTIAVEGRRTSVPWTRVRWLVLARTPGGPPSSAGHVVELAGGSRFRTETLAFKEGILEGRAAASRHSVAQEALGRLRFQSDAYRYLSDLEPARVKREPFVDVVWPPRFDQAVTHGPLRIEGRTYPKGIGMHARTEMTFALGGSYSAFHATVGVDDAAGQLGSVLFRLLADGRTVYESGAMGGGEPARTIAVDIAGAQELTLVADFGDPLVGSGNLADWADARVVRAQERLSGGAVD
ncbi:MAG: NPCBM/NEW2 domain-containing protein [Planctomycetota bacterium]